MYSATIPKGIQSLANFAFCGGDYKYVDCVGEEENTHQHVLQEYLVCDIKDQACELYFILHEKIAQSPKSFKIIVFFTTARLTQFFATLMNAARLKVFEIHSRRTQNHRTKVSSQFRISQTGILFSSDVTARGMDYPDVTSVIQVGIPSSTEQYVHRIGRTARIGKGGSGVLLLCQFERFMVRKIQREKLPLVERKPANPDILSQIQRENIGIALQIVLEDTQLITRAYQSWLGFYKTYLRLIGWSSQELVDKANWWICGVIGSPRPPALKKRTIGKMGLRGVRGLNAF